MNSKLNCGTAFLMESLKQLEDIKTHKDGLLYGIPISIKENVDYEVLQFFCVCMWDMNKAQDFPLELLEWIYLEDVYLFVTCMQKMLGFFLLNCSYWLARLIVLFAE